MSSKKQFASLCLLSSVIFPFTMFISWLVRFTCTSTSNPEEEENLWKDDGQALPTYILQHSSHSIHIIPGGWLLPVKIIYDQCCAHPPPLHAVVQLIPHVSERFLWQDQDGHTKKKCRWNGQGWTETGNISYDAHEDSEYQKSEDILAIHNQSIIPSDSLKSSNFLSLFIFPTRYIKYTEYVSKAGVHKR